MAITQIFKKTGIEGVKKDKKFRILCELGSVKKSPKQSPFKKVKILKQQNWDKKYVIDFSKISFKDKSLVTLDLMDGPKNKFYQVKMGLWLKEIYAEMIVWLCGLKLMSKPLLEHLK